MLMLQKQKKNNLQDIANEVIGKHIDKGLTIDKIEKGTIAIEIAAKANVTYDEALYAAKAAFEEWMDAFAP